MNHLSEASMTQNPAAETYLNMPSLQSAAQIGATSLFGCLDSMKHSSPADMLVYSSCSSDLAQACATTDKKDLASKSVAIAVQAACDCINLLNTEGPSDGSSYYDKLYKAVMLREYAGYANIHHIWTHSGYTRLSPSIDTFKRIQSEVVPELNEDYTMLRRSKGTSSFRDIKRHQMRIAFMQLANSWGNMSRYVAIPATLREQHATGTVDDGFDVKCIFPDNTYIPVRIVDNAWQLEHEQNRQIAELRLDEFDNKGSAKIFHDILYKLSGYKMKYGNSNSARSITGLANDVHDFIIETPRIPMGGV